MGPRRRWLLGMMLAAGVGVEAADSGKRVVTAVSRVDKPVAAAVGSGGGRINFTQLTSGVSAPFSLPARPDPTLWVGDAGFRITVPSGATRLTVSLVTTTPNVDVDLFVRFGQDPAVSGGNVVADYESVGTTGNETITITGGSSPPLQAGTYHVALLLFDTNVSASGTVTATVETGGGPPPPTTGGAQLTSGVSAPFSFSSVATPTLFLGGNSYRIDVPSGATQLVVQVNTTTPGVDIDLFVRFGQDTAVSGGSVVADYRSEGSTGNETITITGGSTPPLQAGTYFISLGVFTTGTPASGTVIATVTGAGGGGGACTTSLVGSGPNLIQNGSFENGTSPWTFTNVDFWTGWTCWGARTDSTPPTLRAGAVCIDLNGASPGVLSQTFATTPGTTYVVRFQQAGNPDGGAALRRLRASAGTEVRECDFDVTGRTAANMGFLERSFSFVAGSGSTSILEFRSLLPSSGVYGPVVDDVRVQAVGGGGSGSTPILSVSPSLDFGSVTVGQQRDLLLPIRNTGTANLNVTGLTSSNPSEFSVVGATSFTVAPAGQQDVTLRFRPSATGARSSNLTIATNDPSRPSTSISLTGTGTSTGPVIVASTTTLNFTTSPGSNPAPQTFTLRNTSSALTYLITSTQPWLSTNPTSGNLQNGQTITVTASVNVAGLAAGNYSADLRVVLPVGAAVQQAAPQAIITVRLTIQAGGGGGSCPAGPSATPVITAGAIVNAASFVSSALPGGAIARGAIFSMFLQNGGPTALQVASTFPLQTTLGCVSVRITQGSTSVDAIPLAAITSQVNAIMPSNAPLGDATITVTFNGRTSAAQRVRIVESAFGFFTANQNGMGPAIVQNFESQTSLPLNSPRKPILRGRRGIAYGTGLGGIRSADNQPAPGGDPRASVELTIGNKRAVVEYAGRTPGFAGLDQINFVVPDDTPLGCYVPMSARIGGLITNTVTIAVSDNPSECSDPFNPYATFASRGGKLGSIQMIRVNARLQLDATTNFTNIDADVGTALFSELPPGGEFAYNPITALPPLGSCTSASAGGIDLSGLLGGSVPDGSAATGRILNAGPALQVSGAGGTKVLPRSTDVGGIYFNLIGGTVPIPGLPLPSSPLYLNPGDFTVTGPGGPDIGAFSAPFRVPASFTWSNREAVTQSNRANGVNVSWSGGDPSSQAITILGGNLDQDSGAGALFVCFAPFGPGSFAVPASITQALPPSNLTDPSKTIGFLLVGAGPAGNFPTFTAPNMDQGYVFFAQFSVTSVIWR